MREIYVRPDLLILFGVGFILPTPSKIWLVCFSVWLRQNCQCCGRLAQYGWRTKINWTKTAHNTHAYACIRVRFSLVLIHTHTHAHCCVWIRVEHWAYWRPQLVVAEKLVTPDSQKATSQRLKTTRKHDSICFRHGQQVWDLWFLVNSALLHYTDVGPEIWP